MIKKLLHWLKVAHSEDIWEYATKGSIPYVARQKYRYPPQERVVVIIDEHKEKS